jgi:hypothetical protein
MTSPEIREAKRRIQHYVRQWKCLVPPGFTVKHVFIEASAGDGEETVLANTCAQWEYHAATIKWYLFTCAGVDDRQLEHTVVHELTHVLTDPMESHLRGGKMDKTCEHTVETIAQAIIRARLQNWVRKS